MELVGGTPCPAERVRDGLGEAEFATLVREGVLELHGDGSDVACRVRLLSAVQTS
jgi:hypothetical protein